MSNRQTRSDQRQRQLPGWVQLLLESDAILRLFKQAILQERKLKRIELHPLQNIGGSTMAAFDIFKI